MDHTSSGGHSLRLLQSWPGQGFMYNIYIEDKDYSRELAGATYGHFIPVSDQASLVRTPTISA